MTKGTKQTIIRYTKKRIKEMLKGLEEVAIKDIERALDSGAIAEDSDFLKDNALLASCLIENKMHVITIKYPDYVKESENIKLFI